MSWLSTHKRRICLLSLIVLHQIEQVLHLSGHLKLHLYFLSMQNQFEENNCKNYAKFKGLSYLGRWVIQKSLSENANFVFKAEWNLHSSWKELTEL